MNRDEFLEEQSVAEEVAVKAWEQADGDAEDARELLSVTKLTVRGRLFNPESNINGVFVLTWDLSEEELTNFGAVMVNDSVESVDLEASHEEFLRALQEIEDSPKIMSGYSEELQETLHSLWNDPSEELLNLSAEDFPERLIKLHENELGAAFDFNETEVEITVEQHRRVQEVPTEEDLEEEPEGEEDEQSVTVPSCDVHVTPVQGVSVTRLQPDDMIYVEIGDIPEEWSQLKPVLEDLRDDSGLVPAQLIKKAHSDEGRVELEVQFGKKVYGSLTCGRDVSLMVPEETLEKYDESGVSSLQDVLSSKIIVPAFVFALIVLIVLLFLL